MTQEIVQLTAADFDEAMELMNLSFGATGTPREFDGLLPGLYRPTDAQMGCNHAVRRDGRIRAVVGVFPISWQVAGRELRVGGIGGVCAHPECRGEGWMTVLMRHCVDLMRQQGYHLSFLGGQRQRYLYYGFEKCGGNFTLTVNKNNLRHVFGEPAPIRFACLEAKDPRLGALVSMHKKQVVHCRRPPQKFHDFLVNWLHKPFVAVDEADHTIGYLVADEALTRVVELVSVHDAAAVNMIRAWVEQHEHHDVHFSIHPVRRDLVRRVMTFCESPSMGTSGNWQVFDWESVIDALLRLRRLCGPLTPGSVVVAIDDAIQLHLEVSSDECRCTATGAAPDVRLDAPTAMRVFFGPLAPSQSVELPKSATALDAWCPLPLWMTNQDAC